MHFIYTGKVLVVRHDHVLENIQLLKVFSPWDLNYQQTTSSVYQKETQTNKKMPPKCKVKTKAKTKKSLASDLPQTENTDF